MISEEYTYKIFGYYIQNLSPQSSKRIVVICPDCYKYEDIAMSDYHDERKCRSCAVKNRPIQWDNIKKMNKAWTGAHHTDITKQSISNSHKGKEFTQKHKDNIRKAHEGPDGCMTGYRHTNETKRKISNAHRGKIFTLKQRIKVSATKQGILYDEWENFAPNSPYCPAFNTECKESNREKYNRRCFICNLLEKENIISTGRHQRLSVHHIDMDKMQGCDNRKWKLVPVCIHCHGKIHNDLWEARIIWLLNNVWSGFND